MQLIETHTDKLLFGLVEVIACLICIHYITVVITMLFTQCASGTVLPFPCRFLPELQLGWRALHHVQWDRCCYFQSNWLMLSPSKHSVADSMSLVLALYLPHSLHFFSRWLLNSLVQSASQFFAFKSVPKLFTTELHVTHIDLLKSDFVLLVSVILTIYCNICWQYHDLAAFVLHWYESWTSDITFCGINFTVTLLITFVTEWLVAFSTSSKIFWFCLLIIWFTPSSPSLKLVWVIHAFLLECHSSGRCLVSIHCSLSAQGGAALPKTRG